MSASAAPAPVCFCGAPMQLRRSRYGKFYGCTRYPECDGRHGAHPNGSPLGIPADKATREARIRAHEAFDRLWRSGEMRRPDAYRWLREQMGLSRSEGHISRFTAEQCERLVELVTAETECGEAAVLYDPGDPSVGEQPRHAPVRCSLRPKHDGDHEDEDERVRWSR